MHEQRLPPVLCEARESVDGSLSTYHPKVSILIPTFNASGYVSNIIECLNDQSRPFDEVIFYDDGSTDDTLNKLRKTSFKVICSDVNRGPAFSRNQLLDAFTGEFFKFHDVDDPLPTNFLAEFGQELENEKIYFCSHDMSDYSFTTEGIGEIINEYEFIFRNTLPLNCFVFPADVAQIRFNANLMLLEDKEFILRTVRLGKRYTFCNSVKVHISASENSFTRKVDWDEHFRSLREFYMSMFRNLPDEQKEHLLRYTCYVLWCLYFESGCKSTLPEFEKLFGKQARGFGREMFPGSWSKQWFIRCFGIAAFFRARRNWHWIRRKIVK